MDRNKLSSGDPYIIHQHQKHRKYKNKTQILKYINDNLELLTPPIPNPKQLY